MSDADINNDGVVSEREADQVYTVLHTRTALAIGAFVVNCTYAIGMLGLVAFGGLSPEAATSLGTLTGSIFTANTGIIAAYYTVEAWMSKSS